MLHLVALFPLLAVALAQHDGHGYGSSSTAPRTHVVTHDNADGAYSNHDNGAANEVNGAVDGTGRTVIILHGTTDDDSGYVRYHVVIQPTASDSDDQVSFDDADHESGNGSSFSHGMCGLETTNRAFAWPWLQVKVGGTGPPKYYPSALSGVNHLDTIIFIFDVKNHTFTQSTFAKPCDSVEGGFTSGFVPNDGINKPYMVAEYQCTSMNQCAPMCMSGSFPVVGCVWHALRVLLRARQALRAGHAPEH
jgi:hypothetical protein